MRNSILFYIIYSIIIICGFVGNSLAQIPNNNFSQLRFNVQTTKNWYVLGEPIPLILIVKFEPTTFNISTINLSTKSKRLRFLVEYPDKSVLLVEPHQLYSGVCSDCRTNYPLLPNMSFQTKDALQNFVESIFPTEGTYKVWAELCDKECFDKTSQKIVSNQIEFKVLEPQGKDRDAYTLFKKILGYDWYFLARQDEKYLVLAEDFLTNYSGTPYSDYVADRTVNYFSQIGNFQKADLYSQKISPRYIFKNEVYVQRHRNEDAWKANK